MYFGPTTCKDATYNCRVKKQYVQIIHKTNKLRELFNGIHEKFLKAIDHMEFHPTLGKEKKGTSFKLHKQSTENTDPSIAHQIRYLSPDDIEMLRQGNEYSNAQNIMSIKKNIQALYDQNILQEKQIIELTHYLNITYGHVWANRQVINELNIKVTTLNKTLMAIIRETKFIKFTVAILTDMRMTLAQLSLGIMSLQENVNAIYEYMRVLSTRRVNPLIIPPNSLQLVLAQAKEDMKRNP